MSELTLQVDRTALKKSLKRQKYELAEVDDALIIASLHTKPRTWIIYLMVFFGLMRIYQQKIFHALISFALAITAGMVAHFETKKYNLTYTDISRVTVRENGVTLSFRDNKSPVMVTPEQINSITVDTDYEGRNTLCTIMITDTAERIFNLFVIYHKSEETAVSLADEIIQLMMSKLEVEAA